MDDVPQDIRMQLYAEEQQHLDRKRKRQDSSGRPASTHGYQQRWVPDVKAFLDQYIIS